MLHIFVKKICASISRRLYRGEEMCGYGKENAAADSNDQEGKGSSVGLFIFAALKDPPMAQMSWLAQKPWPERSSWLGRRIQMKSR